MKVNPPSSGTKGDEVQHEEQAASVTVFPPVSVVVKQSLFTVCIMTRSCDVWMSVNMLAPLSN